MMEVQRAAPGGSQLSQMRLRLLQHKMALQKVEDERERLREELAHMREQLQRSRDAERDLRMLLAQKARPTEQARPPGKPHDRILEAEGQDLVEQRPARRRGQWRGFQYLLFGTRSTPRYVRTPDDGVWEDDMEGWR